MKFEAWQARTEAKKARKAAKAKKQRRVPSAWFLVPGAAGLDAFF